MKILNSALVLGLLMFTPTLARADDITVNFEQVTDQPGNLLWALYNSEADYTTQTSEFLSGQVAPIPGNMTITIPNVPAGSYALTAFHDVYGTGELKRNFLGMPEEQFAISNITQTLWSQPTWSEVEFQVVDGQPTVVPMLLKMQ